LDIFGRTTFQYKSQIENKQIKTSDIFPALCTTWGLMLEIDIFNTLVHKMAFPEFNIKYI